MAEIKVEYESDNSLLGDATLEPEIITPGMVESKMEFESDSSLGYSTFEPEPSTSNQDGFNEEAMEMDSHFSGSAAEIDKDKLTGVSSVLFGEFYKIAEQRTSTPYQARMIGIIAICQVCHKKVKGSLRVSSNLIKHLRERHPKQYEAFQKKKYSIVRKYTHCNKGSLDRDILAFICETYTPLSVIEHGSFLKLLPNKNIPNGREIIALLSAKHRKFEQMTRVQLQNIEFLCATVDIWSKGRATFFGYTCHWLEGANFERKSAALACRRFKRMTSFERITDIISEIHCQYNISSDKVVYTTIENGANFDAAFRQLGVNMEKKGEDVDEDDDEDSSDDYEYASALEFHNNYMPTSTKHFQCANHTLNLLATTDFIEVLNDSINLAARRIHSAAFNRCTEIWNKCKRPKCAEIYKTLLSCSQLVTPCTATWKSLYDSVLKLIRYKSKLNELCDKLNITVFTADEIAYLEEYAGIMQPIAEAIEFLERKESMHFGYFIPTLVSLKIKMRSLPPKDWKFLREVNTKMQTRLLQRFEKYFRLHSDDAWDAVIAAILIPEVKLKFCKVLLESASSYTIHDIREKMKEYALQFKELSSALEPSNLQPIKRSNSTSFLQFDDELPGNPEDNHQSNLATEISLYLSDNGKGLGALERFPVIRKMFLKYNTPLPSSAPVEKFLQFADIVKRSERQLLNKQVLEMIVLKKANEL